MALGNPDLGKLVHGKGRGLLSGPTDMIKFYASTPGRPKTAPCRDSVGVARAIFLTPRSLRKWLSCLKSEARFPVRTIRHLAFAQVGGPPVRLRDFRVGKTKHVGRFRSERGVLVAVSVRGGVRHMPRRGFRTASPRYNPPTGISYQVVKTTINPWKCNMRPTLSDASLAAGCLLKCALSDSYEGKGC